MGNGQFTSRNKPSRRQGLTIAQQAGVMLGSAALVVAVFGAYLVNAYVNSSATMSAAAAARDNTGSIIARTANGDGCHRKRFDNVTGTITDDGPAPCTAVDSRTSSTSAVGRFGAIAGGFQNR
jgi:hypothetical protein